jgi:predicted O-methyltransferase YrrM
MPMLQRLRWVFRSGEKPTIPVVFERSAPGWLAENFGGPFALAAIPDAALIEERAALTHRQGPRPLWSGYRGLAGYAGDTEGSRTSNEVRSSAAMGRFYHHLALRRHPSAILEFGTAFGVSGMYWLAGLKSAGGGMLYTFEPNEDWALLAKANLDAVSDRYRLTVGTFEDHADTVLDGTGIDIAFIDAIHTGDFVNAQFAIVKRFLKPGALVLFDDINFSDDMRACWQGVARAPEILASARVGERLCVVEMARA